VATTKAKAKAKAKDRGRALVKETTAKAKDRGRALAKETTAQSMGKAPTTATTVRDKDKGGPRGRRRVTATASGTARRAHDGQEGPRIPRAFLSKG
jgi:hypothetical protein